MTHPYKKTQLRCPFAELLFVPRMVTTWEVLWDSSSIWNERSTIFNGKITINGHVQQHNSYVSLPEGTQPKTQVSTVSTKKTWEKKTTTCVGFRVCIQPFIPRCWQCRRPLQPQPPVLVAPSQGGHPRAAAPWYSPASCRCGPGRRTTRSSPRCRLGATATVYLYRNYIFVWKIISYDSSECMI